MVEPTKVCKGPTCNGTRKPWSAFYRDNRTGGPRTYCKACNAELSARYQRNNPSKMRAARIRFLESVKKDPERHAEHLAYQREWRRRKFGVAPENFRSSAYMTPDRGGDLLPAGPFASWLRHVLERDGENIATVAERLGMHDKQMRWILNGHYDVVDETLVDRALVADGTHLREVYPEWYEEAA